MGPGRSDTPRSPTGLTPDLGSVLTMPSPLCILSGMDWDTTDDDDNGFRGRAAHLLLAVLSVLFFLALTAGLIHGVCACIM